MSEPDMHYWPAHVATKAIKAKKLSCREYCTHIVSRIEKLNPILNAFNDIRYEQVLSDSDKADEILHSGQLTGPLHGIPISIKDGIFTKGLLTTFGSKLHEGREGTFDAPVVERLKKAGAIMLGKTNMPAFGHMGVTHSLLYGITRNPWNPTYSPGGSTGGGSSAVSAGLGPITIGSDGGGSIRIPASFTGIFGIKPSLGRVPVYPTYSHTDQLSHIGPMTRSVMDAAIVMDTISGPDERDFNTLPDYAGIFAEDAQVDDSTTFKIGWSDNLGFAEVDNEVKAIAKTALDKLENAGCFVQPADIDTSWRHSTDHWFNLFTALYAAPLRTEIERDVSMFEQSFIDFVEYGNNVSAKQLIEAGNFRRRMVTTGHQIFKHHDILATPTVAIAPLKVGQQGPTHINGKATTQIDWSALTYVFNMTGYPAATVPAGFTKQGLPVGLQLIGPRFADSKVVQCSALFEKNSPWTQHQPSTNY